MPVNFESIRSRRLKQELTVAEAARRAGWPLPRWANVESGRYPDPRVSTLEAVSKVLRCKMDDLVRKD